MPTPREGYWLDGKQLPSVTTVLFPYSEGGADGLIYWAQKLLFAWIEENLPLTSMEGIPKRLFIEARKLAGDIGTMAHEAIQYWSETGQTYQFVGQAKITDPAKLAYGSFLKWLERNNFKITHNEVRLTSKTHLYGGTLDVMGLTPVGRALGDWKTSNFVKKTMALQLAAYRQLWNENNPGDPITGGCNLVRFDKTTGMFQHDWFPDHVMDHAFKMFLNLLEVYKGMREIPL